MIFTVFGSEYMLKKLKIMLCLIVSVFIVICASVMANRDFYSARAVCLYNATDDRVVYAYNENAKMAPASITKILTAITALENEKPYRTVIVSEKSAGTEGSSIYLKGGEKLRLMQLIYGLMLNSGNDAANAIADYFGNEKFVRMMNDTAKKAGATMSHFENPSGLDGETHLVTAVDMAKITDYALGNKDFKKVVSTKEALIINNDGKKRHLKNHNKLLWYSDKYIGVKTGFTKKAGRTLVSAVEHEGKTYILVTLKAPDDWNDHKKIYETYIFK